MRTSKFLFRPSVTYSDSWRRLRGLAPIPLSMALAACGSFSMPTGLWPFGGDIQGREPPPPEGVPYRCANGGTFYLRFLQNGSAWVILPEREFRLDKSGGDGRYSNGVAVLEVGGAETRLNDGPGIAYRGCRAVVPGQPDAAPAPEAAPAPKP